MSCLGKFNIIFICVFLFLTIHPLFAQCGTGEQVGDVVTPYWKEQNGSTEGVPIPNMSSDEYALVNVIKGVQYEINAYYIQICHHNGGQQHPANSSFFGARTRFTAEISGQVRVYYTGGSSGVRIKIIGGANNIDNQNSYNSDNYWRTHFYREKDNFTNYLGYKDHNNHSSFDEHRDPAGNSSPIEVYSQGDKRAEILRYFSARSLMKNTQYKGFYFVRLGADDGTRLFIKNGMSNENKVYDRWNPTGDYSVKTQVIKLTGNDELRYEYFNDNIPLRYIFEINPADRIIENTTLTSSNGTPIIGTLNGKAICIGSSTTLDGDDFAQALPNTFTNPTFQWYYATSPTGTRHPIGGNTRQYVVNTNASPFNNLAGGSYYFFREAKITINNIGVSPEPESIMSDPIRIDVISKLNVSVSPNEKSFCQGESDAKIKVTINNGSGGQPPFTFHYEIEGVTQQHQSNNHIFEIPINTNQTGEFHYQYTSVTDGNGCTTPIYQADKIDIIAKPTATFTELNTTLCKTYGAVDVMLISNITGGSHPYKVEVRKTNLQNLQVEGVTTYPSSPPHQDIKIQHSPSYSGSFKYEIIRLLNENGCWTTYTDKSFIVTVTAPSIVPPEDITLCLPDVETAVYDEGSGNTNVSENSYVLPLGDTTLDVTINPVPCCPNPVLKWTINNANVRTGQPSTHTGISFENATSTDETYNITYWLECNGQKYGHVTRQVRITPRPVLQFQ